MTNQLPTKFSVFHFDFTEWTGNWNNSFPSKLPLAWKDVHQRVRNSSFRALVSSYSFLVSRSFVLFRKFTLARMYNPHDQVRLCNSINDSLLIAVPVYCSWKELSYSNTYQWVDDGMLFAVRWWRRSMFRRETVSIFWECGAYSNSDTSNFRYLFSRFCFSPTFLVESWNMLRSPILTIN